MIAPLGTTVHFVQGVANSDQVTHKAAIVTAVESTTDNGSVVSLAVFGVSSVSFVQHVLYNSAGNQANTWHLPEA